MNLHTAWILIPALLLAYSNGANDNFKGVATLFGSGTASYRKALTWATVTTGAGSLLALMLARGLVATFTGKGLVPDAITREPTFLASVSLAAAVTVLLATRLGLPVSTTHALTGALVGSGALATHGHVALGTLGGSFLLPLGFSPVASMVLTLMLYPVFKRLRRRSGVVAGTYVRVGDGWSDVVVQADGATVRCDTAARFETGQEVNGVERYRGEIFGLEASAVVDGLHYASAGAVGFARGLNDTPKIVALLIGAQAVAPNVGLALVAIVMAVGGILNARRVADTLSHKIARMNPGQGFTANLVTSLLVATASRFGLPVSTTHVSVGSLFGIGLVNGTARGATIVAILTAWVTTLPLAALLGMVSYLLLSAIA